MQPSATPNLRADAVLDFWRGQGPAVAQIIRRMEAAEPWVKDDLIHVRQALERFGDTISTVEAAQLERLSPRDLMVVLGYISSGRALMLARFLADKVPEMAERLLSHCIDQLGEAHPAVTMVEADAAKIYLDRLRYLERANVLMRVFGHRNALAMMDAIEEITLSGAGGNGSSDRGGAGKGEVRNV